MRPALPTPAAARPGRAPASRQQAIPADRRSHKEPRQSGGSCEHIELHRSAGAVDARRPSHRLRLSARETGSLGDGADKFGGNVARLGPGLRREAGNVESVVAGEDESAFPAHAASPTAAGFRIERTSAAKARALAMAAATLPTWLRSSSRTLTPLFTSSASIASNVAAVWSGEPFGSETEAQEDREAA